MGSKKTASTSQNSTSQYDNRMIVGDGSLAVGPNASYASWASSDDDTSFQVSTSDSRSSSDSRSYSSNYSSNYSSSDSRSNTNSGNTSYAYTGTDGGAVQIAQRNADLLHDISANQTDGIKTIAAFGADALKTMGAAATDLYSQAGKNSAQAWGHTLDASEAVLDKLMTTSQQANDAAKVVAQAAIASYQPTDNKMGDALKYGAIAAAAVVALSVLKKA